MKVVGRKSRLSSAVSVRLSPKAKGYRRRRRATTASKSQASTKKTVVDGNGHALPAQSAAWR